jgi:hypothetical protein
VVGLNGAARVMTCAEVLRHAVLDAVEVRVVAGEDGVMKSGLRIGVWAEYVVGLGRWFGGFAPPPKDPRIARATPSRTATSDREWSAPQGGQLGELG